MNQSSGSFKSLLLIGLGFFAVSASWAAYNAYLPLMLRGAGLSATAVGVIMALDNAFALTLQPLFGMISDRTRSPWGRRIPFALFLAPIAAVALMLMPIALRTTVPMLVVLVVIFAIAMACWRAPIVALMPDLVVPENRSRANGVINFMGSLGTALIFGIGGLLVASYSYAGPFTLTGVLMVLAVILLVLFVRENPQFRTKKFGFVSLDNPMLEHGPIADAGDASPQDPAHADSGPAAAPASTPREGTGVGQVPVPSRIPARFVNVYVHLRSLIVNFYVRIRSLIMTFYVRFRNLIAPPLDLTGPQKRSLIFILVALFVYTLGSSATDTFVTTYLNEALGVPESRVTLNLLPYLAASILFAIPAGFVGQWLGRRRSMMIGLFGSAVLFVFLSQVDNVATLRLLMPIYGVLWIVVVVNALPLTVELGGVERTGTLTAYYYLATSMGSVIGPILFGIVRDLMGDFTLLFIFAAIAFAAGAVVLGLFVRHGEAGDSKKIGIDA